jgi:glycosyltransferase involved in cell wall biosynthesis
MSKADFVVAPKALRVLLLSTSYPADGKDWRGIFMGYLVAALSRRPDIKLTVWAPPGQLPASATSIATSDETVWLKRLMASGGISHLMRHSGHRSLLAPVKLLRMIAAVYRRSREVDIYHVNWLQCALPLPRNGKPVLITVLGNDLKLLRLPLMRYMLRRVMRRREVAICPNGEWMLGPLQTAFGDIAKVIPVSFGIDPDWYNIKRDVDVHAPKRWLVVTRITADKLGPLFDWSQSFFHNAERELHLFGPMQEQIGMPEWIHYHGAAIPEQLMVDWFPNAYGLITLSRHAEGRPQVMLEAMAAAMPIIASRTPAHAGIVNDGITGILCDSEAGYGAALLKLEDSETNRQFGSAAREWAAHEIGSWDDCAHRYNRIYRKLLGEDNRG